MKLKSLLILIIVIAVGAAAYYLRSNPKQGVTEADSYLIPGLSTKLNDAKKLTILGVGNVLLAAISKSENNWIVENRDGYEADIDTIRAAFKDLAEARLIEIKTSNPENYGKLGVRDITDASAQGVQFSIEGLGEPVNIIAGKKDSNRKNLQYIRRAGEQQSWLINKNLNLNRDVTQWLRKDILDVPPERIKSVKIQHKNGSEVSIENKGAGQYEFMLSNPLPEGKEVSESELYQVANALSSLQLRDVVALEKLDKDIENPVTTTFVTYDGLTVTAKSFSVKEETYCTFAIEFDADDIERDDPSPEQSADLALNTDIAAAEELAQKTTPRLEGWAFILPMITRDALIKRLEDFLLNEDT